MSYKTHGATFIKIVLIIAISLIPVIGLWSYHNTQLKNMENLLQIANEEYAFLDDSYLSLDESFNQLNNNHNNLIGEYSLLDNLHIELENSIPLIIEETFSSGYYEGNISGHEQGYSLGNDVGFLTGYDTGYDSGEYYGYRDGHLIGKELGYSNGLGDGYTDGHLVGYNDGYEIGQFDGAETYASGDYDGFYWFLRDPTYSEVMSFIRIDKTDRNKYDVDEYNCGDYTFDVRNNAANLYGYRSFGVYVELTNSAHMIIGFNTTDRGMIFIEPQTDYRVNLLVGIEYWDKAMQSSKNYEHGYKIIRWNIHW